jgi:hypothetical protein
MQGLHRQLSTAGPDPGEDHARPQDRGHGQADRRSGLRALWADERGDRADGGGERIIESNDKLFLFIKNG